MHKEMAIFRLRFLTGPLKSSPSMFVHFKGPLPLGTMSMHSFHLSDTILNVKQLSTVVDRLLRTVEEICDRLTGPFVVLLC
jgi:hypothetical protein